MHWKLFERLFEAHAKRKAIDKCEGIKQAMIAGVWGNSNYDSQEEGKEAARPKLLDEIEEGFKRAVFAIRSGGERDKREDIDWTDPFFASIKAPRIGSEQAIEEGMEEERQQRMRENAALRKELDQS